MMVADAASGPLPSQVRPKKPTETPEEAKKVPIKLLDASKSLIPLTLASSTFRNTAPKPFVTAGVVVPGTVKFTNVLLLLIGAKMLLPLKAGNNAGYAAF